MPSYGFFVTKRGKDVLQKQSPLQYVINSDYQTFKICREISTSISVPSGSEGTKTVAHELGYHPAFLAFYKLKPSSSYWWLDATSLNSTVPDNDGYRSNRTFINKNEIKFSAQDGESVGAATILAKAFIMINPISLVPPSTIGSRLVPGFGFKVSQPEVDVLNAKAHQLLLSSKYDSLKFHMEKTIYFTIPAGQLLGSASFEHGLGYVPIFVVSEEEYDDNTLQRMPPVGRVPQPVSSSVKANKSTITATAVQIAAPSDVTWRFRITVMKNVLSIE
jgi:hypothetical protein